MTTYPIITVPEWNGRWARKPVAEKLLDTECAVHHVGGGAWMGGTVAKDYAASRAAAIRVFWNLNEYAINTKKYSFLDYDILVWYDRFNDICWIGEGRGQWLSAATADRNEIAEAIVLCGNTHVRHPLPQELEGLARGIVHGIQKTWMSQNTRIYPHRDNPAHPGATQCCGQYLIAQLPTVIRRVGELQKPEPQPPPQPQPQPGGYIVPDIFVPHETIRSAPPSRDGRPVDNDGNDGALWLWQTAFQQMQIERPGTFNPNNSGITRQIQFGINNAIDEGTISGPKVPVNGKYDQATAAGWDRWLKR